MCIHSYVHNTYHEVECAMGLHTMLASATALDFQVNVPKTFQVVAYSLGSGEWAGA